MTARYRLPAAAAPAGSWLDRSKAFLLGRWSGRILLAVLAIEALSALGVPVPGLLAGLARVCLVLYVAWGVIRLIRHLLWRIRTKLILSYLFIAVVPVVLLALFFVIAAALFAGLVAGHMVSAEIERQAQALGAVAQAAVAGLGPEDAEAARAVAARLGPARAIHSKVTWTLVRGGRTLAAQGDAPRALPAWWREQPRPAFAALVGEPSPAAAAQAAGASGPAEGGSAEPEEPSVRERLRAVAASGDVFLVLDAPLDAELFRAFEERSGIRILTVGARVEKHGTGENIDLTVDDEGARKIRLGQEDISGIAFFALPERVDWATGKSESEALTFHFQPYEFLRRLSPGALNTADILVKGLAAVGVVFLVMYSGALLVGLLLARSITRSVHALSVGTLRLRQGDFTHPIPIRSRDQLGELAESFNAMAADIRGLLLEQAEKQRLEEELRIARQIQMSLLPAEGAFGLPGLRVAALCLPANEVGGDYYDLLPLSPTRLGVLVADVSGKGTSAALYMAELKGLVMSLSRRYASPAELLCEANRILASTLDSRSFITMTYAVVDIGARTMRYARAGHNPIIQLQAAGGGTRVLAPPGLGLGLDPGERFEAILEEAEVPLHSGDLFLFFTDGLSEAMNERSEIFGERRLRDLIEEAQGGDEALLKDRILSEIRSFVGGAAQHDDMTLVILKVV